MHVILLAAVTANGFIARSTDELANWTSKEDKKFFVEETKKHGAVIMGRTTFATIGRPLPGRLIIVLTNDPAAVTEVPGSVEAGSGELQDVLNELETRGFSSVVVAGGSNVYSQFLNAGLIDEIALTIEPVLFTGGIKLAENLKLETALELLTVEKLGTNSILARYKVIK